MCEAERDAFIQEAVEDRRVANDAIWVGSMWWAIDVCCASGLVDALVWLRESLGFAFYSSSNCHKTSSSTAVRCLGWPEVQLRTVKDR
jgi:hypothetical protein